MASKPAGKQISEMPPGVFLTLLKINPMGALQARRQQSGAVALYWRYSIGAKSERVSIGLYDSASPPKSLTPTAAGLSIAAAIRAAETLAVEHHQNRVLGGRPAIVQARRDALDASERQRRDSAENTLKALLDQYCDQLKAMGRRSHADARGIFRLHIEDPWPKIAGMPAKEVSSEQIADIMRKLIDAGKGRTSNKLRAYARAAYGMALAAKSKPSIPVAFKKFGVTSNPVAETQPDETQNKADKRPLSADEMVAYWQAIRLLPGFAGALLRVHLLTGGQRIEQLVNLRTAAVTDGQITLLDGKGRPGRAARQHTVPLIEDAAIALAQCKPAGEFAFSTDGGKTHVAATTLARWAAAAAGEVIEGFQAKRVRSGVETLLASAGVSKDVRGRLQSHGISGVQDRSYNAHDYMPEKRKALETMLRMLNRPKSVNVVPMRNRA